MAKFKGRELWDRLRRKLGFHVHDRKVFCFQEVAFVKCTTCGAESLPWLVPKKTAEEWAESNPKAIHEFIAIEKNIAAKAPTHE